MYLLPVLASKPFEACLREKGIGQYVFKLCKATLALRSLEQILLVSVDFIVFEFSLGCCGQQEKADPLQESRMIDKFTLYARKGDCGNGCYSMHRSRHDRCGRPDGGNGGGDGDVILEGSYAVWDFSGLHHHIKAAIYREILLAHSFFYFFKIVQVPFGTVIHIVNSELPSEVENRPSTEMDPWELPGTLDSEPSKLDLQANSCCPSAAEEVEPVHVNGDSSYCTGRTLEESQSMNQSTQSELKDVQWIQYNVMELTEQHNV
ncbi:GTP-binding protein Obg/CgtA putative isoform 2 [Tripterygium wilfordii]|uniref:GTP-binding protein Obg/CgtA putative isoform 2 n=1 Tax=Tripterygium wilfordii TaxID=458696 RepID=A0A7J7DYK1_TRIWF|nr:GTP-binding protein Obg/CgtA putative isoform 2 [Tripterygium wilfordii]